jgi:rubrerythrin
MEKAATLGHNYTGTQMSPENTKKLMDAIDQMPPDVPGDASSMAAARKIMNAEAEGIGTVPVPGSVKGKLKSGFDKALGKRPELLVDKLGERLAFERAGVRAYQAMLAKLEASPSRDSELIATLRQIHDEEASHMRIVKDAMETLGADPTAQTPCADVSGVIGMGAMQVLTDPRTNISQALNALLTLELTDNAAWDLLVDLAQKAGHPHISDTFKHALSQEERHLTTIKSLLKQELESYM